MLFTETKLKDAFIIDIEPREDERGFFARSWCENEFKEHGLNSRLVQCNISYNHKLGTVRGMHFQSAPFSESKLVRCTAGSIFDVMIDLRPNSPTFKQWLGVTLTAKNHRAVFVPAGFAHGFQTLSDDSEVFYQMSEFFYPAHAHGFRWNDPVFGIIWPVDKPIVSKRDQEYPDFSL